MPSDRRPDPTTPREFPHTLLDWQEEENEEHGPPAKYNLAQNPDRIDVSFEDGEHVWIERQNGRIRVHCFHPKNDEPVNIEIHHNQIVIDNYDHSRNPTHV